MKTKREPLNDIDSAVADIRRGRMVIVVDDEERENEGDLVMAAELATPKAVSFMAREGRGLICAPMTAARLEELRIGVMVPDNDESMRTAFTISVDARRGTSTGISAHDRCATLRALADTRSKAAEFARPGHIFPLRYREGGVLVRAGHTEAALDLATLAGLRPVGVICEIMKDNGRMARLPDLRRFAKRHRLKMISIAGLIRHRREKERLVVKELAIPFPTRFGDFDLHLYRSLVDGQHHLAVVKGVVAGKDKVLVRVHSECLTGDVFGSQRCDCGGQLDKALERIEKEGCGVVLYMRQEGRGIGLAPKLHAYALQDQGLDTVQANERLGYKADLREYGTGAQILKDLGLGSIRLMTNNPKKIVGIDAYGLKVVEQVPIETPPHARNLRYLQTKREKMGHLLKLAGASKAKRRRRV